MFCLQVKDEERDASPCWVSTPGRWRDEDEREEEMKRRQKGRWEMGTSVRSAFKVTFSVVGVPAKEEIRGF